MPGPISSPYEGHVFGSEGIEAYYHSNSKNYYMLNRSDRYIALSDVSLKREMKVRGMQSKKTKDELVSEIEQYISNLANDKDITYAGPIAGYKRGFYQEDNRRFLVTESPVIIEPKEGEYYIIKTLINNLLGDAVPYFDAWLKLAYESLIVNERRHAHIMVIAGPHNCGKSLLQKIITKVLGGRAARPYQYMRGGTPFNADLFGAEHLMLEDEVPSTHLKDRREFGAALKSFAVNEDQRCHAKGQTPFMVTPFWRVTISLNDEPENLMVLPPLEDNLGDKLTLLRAIKCEMPMPSGTMTERKAFWAQIEKEIPAYLNALVKWDLPEVMICPRFGCKNYHDPYIIEALHTLSPEERLLNLVETEVYLPWEGHAIELERKLTDKESSVKREAENLLHYNTACGQYLSRLARRKSGRVMQTKNIAGKAVWRITEPLEEDEL